MRTFVTTVMLFAITLLTTTVHAEIRQSQVNFADPYILLDGDYYYAYGTNHGDGIEVWRSKDLTGWEYHGLALHKDNCTEKQWFWAPEVYHKNGKYYMYFSANEHLFVATSNSPLGPFVQQGSYQVKNLIGSEKSIDSHVFFDDDGSAWLFFVRFTDGNCIWSCKLNSDLITPVVGTLKKCINVSQSWEKALGRVNEGPNVVKHNGIYYLTYSANDYQSQNYGVGYATSSSIGSGSWSKYSGNPILMKVEDLVGTGHHTLFKDKSGALKIAFHAHYSTSSVHPRKLYIGDVYFDGNVLRYNFGKQTLRPLGRTEALGYLEEKWNVSEKRANATSKGYDATKIRNFCYQNGKLYCVYNNSEIIILNATTGAYLGKLKEGDICTGGTLKFCDVKCFDGHIVACNLATAAKGEELRLYCWDDDTQDPTLIYNSTNLYGASRLGDCMEIAPNSVWVDNLWFNFANDDGTTCRVYELHRTTEGWAENDWVVTTDGTNRYAAGGSVRAYPNGGLWWIDGLAANPSFFYINNGKLRRSLEITDVGSWGSCHHEFTFRGFKYNVNLKYDNRLNGRCRLQVDDAGDYSHTTFLGEFPADGLGSTTKNANGTGDVIVDTDGTNYVQIWVLSSEQGLCCYSQGDVPKNQAVMSGDFLPVEKWNFSQAAGNASEVGFDATKINNFCYGNGKLFCVYDHSAIKVLDAQTGAYLGDMSLGDAVTGGTYTLSDVSFVDGHLFACNYATEGQQLRIYQWENEQRDADLLYSTTDFMGATSLGKNVQFNRGATYSGPLWISFGNDNGAEFKIIEFHRMSDGNWEQKKSIVTADGSSRLVVGDNARVYPWDGPFWIDGNDCKPTFVAANSDGKIVPVCTVPTTDSWGASHAEFYWGEKKISANLRFDDKANGRAQLIHDQTGDYATTAEFAVFPAAGLGSTQNTSGAADVIVRTDESSYFEGWVFSEGQGIAYYNFGTVLRVEPTEFGAIKPVEKWNLSKQRNNATSKGYDASKIRNFGYQNGKLYCVYNNNQIKVLNAQTGEDLGNLKKGSIVKGGNLELSDVKCFQNHIVACNRALPGEEFRVYVWDDDTKEPYLLYNTNEFGSMASIGDCLDVAQNCNFDTNLWLNFCSDTGAKTTVLEFHRNSSGVWSRYEVNVTSDGTNYFHAGDNARAYPNGGVWWIDGNACQPTYFVRCSNGIKPSKSHPVANETWGGSHHEFTYRGNVYTIAPVFNDRIEGNTDSYYKGGKMRLELLTNYNYAKLYDRGYYPAEGLGDVQNPDCTADCMFNTDKQTYGELWVFSTNQGIAYYAWGDVPPQNPEPVEILTPTITASASSLNFETTAYSEKTATVTISGQKLTGDINLAVSGANAGAFSLSKSTISKDELSADVVVTFSPDKAGTYSATLTASSAGAKDVTVALTGTATAKMDFDDNVTMLTEGWVYSATKGNTAEASWLSLVAPLTRDIAYHNGKLYVAKGNGAEFGIAIVNATTGAKIGDLNVEGISGGTYPIGGLNVIGGKLIASCAAAENHNLKVYMWNDDSSAPTTILDSKPAARGSIIAGDRVNVSGDLTNGKLIFSDGAKIVTYAVTNGSVATTPTTLTLAKSLGSYRGLVDITLMSDGTYWLTAKDTPPTHIAADGSIIETVNATYANGYAVGAKIIDFGKNKYMAAMTYLNASNTTLADGAFTFADITGGINVNEPQTYPQNATTGLGATRNTNMTQSLVSTVENNTLKIWALSSLQGIGYWYYNGESQSAVETISAGAMRIGYNGREVSVTGADAARISVYSTSGAMVADVRGENTLNVSLLARGVYIVRALDRKGNVATSKIMR